jgi:AcrR family transcriptional regulator
MNSARDKSVVESGLATRDRILDTAERMFAGKGYKGVSVRSITRASGVNLAAIHYHFGSKERLLQEIFERRCGPMNKERIRLLGHCRKGPRRPPLLVQLIDAYLRPTLVWSKDDVGPRRFMRLRAALGFEREDMANKLIAGHFNKVSRLFIRRLREVGLRLSEEELYWRLHFLLGIQYYTMGNPGRIQKLSGGLCDPSDSTRSLRYIVPFLAAGFLAPAADSAKTRSKAAA